MAVEVPFSILDFLRVNLGILVGFLGASMQLHDYLRNPFEISNLQARFEESYDFVIIGGGASGSAVAARLSEHPHASVLLLEAGGNPNPVTLVPAAAPYQGHPTVAFEYMTVPQNGSAFGSVNQQVLHPRGRGLGGSSNLNFMIYNRGNPHDFDRWAAITGDPRWSFKSVLPFFLKMEDYHGFWDDGLGNGGLHAKGGPLRVERLNFAPGVLDIMKAAEEMGYPVRDPNQIQIKGFSPIDFTQHRGTRFGSYRAYLKPVEFRENLRISRYSLATKIHFDEKGKAIGVSYLKHGIKHYVTAKKEIILCAGAIASPKLLMLSGIGPSYHLEELGIPTLVDLPAVGQNLQDHVATFVGPFILKKKKSSYIPERDLTFGGIGEYLTSGTGPLTLPLGVSVVGMTSTKHTPPPWPNILWSVHSMGVHEGLGPSLDVGFNMKDNLFEKWLKKYEGQDAHFMIQILGLPRSKGHLKLKDASIETEPEIDPNYYSDPVDMKAMIDGIEEFIRIYENSVHLGKKLGAKLIPDKMPGCEKEPYRSRKYWECVTRTVTGTLYDLSGTLKMGRVGDPTSAVDSQLRVIGVQGLRVADSSVMPHITNANTNAVATMIGEVCADLVKVAWGLY